MKDGFKNLLAQTKRFLPWVVAFGFAAFGVSQAAQKFVKEVAPETIEVLEPSVPSTEERKMSMEAASIASNIRGVNRRMTNMLESERNDSVYDAWLSQFDSLKDVAVDRKIAIVDSIVDAQIAYEKDATLYGTDYWATPLQTIEKGRGDSEDIAFLKYNALERAGISRDFRYISAVSKRDDLKPESIAVTVSLSREATGTESLIVLNCAPEKAEGGSPRDYKLHVGANEKGVRYFIVPTKAL